VDQNIQSWRIDSSILIDECSIDKRKINYGRIIQNWTFEKSIGIFLVLMEFNEGLIARKIYF